MFRHQYLSLLALLALAFSGAAMAEPPAKAMQLMNEAKVANGYMNKKMHDEFWAEIKKSIAPDPSETELKQIESSLQDMILTTAAFPVEGWKSAKLSLEQKKVVRTPELQRQTTLLMAKGLPGIAAAIASTDKLLEAAATGKPLNHSGQTMYINEEMINQVLDGMQASLSRLTVLTDPVWTDAMQEQSIPQMGLVVLSHEKFSVTRMKEEASSGYMAARNTGTVQEQILTINFPNKPNVNLDEATLNAFNGAVASMGLKVTPLPTNWRGLKGVTAVMPFEMQGEKSGMAIQAVKRPNTHSVLVVMTMSDGTAADAGLAMDNLLKRIKLN